MVLTQPQVEAAACRIVANNEFYQIASDYIRRKLHVDITPSLQTGVANVFREACIDFLRRGGVATAAEYRPKPKHWKPPWAFWCCAGIY